ncbi:MAG: TagF domain-containing protein, partial [Marinobacter sp.]
SVDRVGRHFPFLAVADYTGTAMDAWRQPDWAAAMEDCILAVLDEGWEEDPWRQKLTELELPVSDSARLTWPLTEGNLMIPGAAREAEWLDALLRRQNGLAVWWTQGSAFVEPSTLLTDGLPKVGQFAAMMVGQWQNHGWQQAELEEQ